MFLLVRSLLVRVAGAVFVVAQFGLVGLTVVGWFVVSEWVTCRSHFHATRLCLLVNRRDWCFCCRMTAVSSVGFFLDSGVRATKHIGAIIMQANPVNRTMGVMVVYAPALNQFQFLNSW